MKGTALAVLPDGRENSAKQLGDYSGARGSKAAAESAYCFRNHASNRQTGKPASSLAARHELLPTSNWRQFRNLICFDSSLVRQT